VLPNAFFSLVIFKRRSLPESAGRVDLATLKEKERWDFGVSGEKWSPETYA
jgi:hypothetical protein